MNFKLHGIGCFHQILFARTWVFGLIIFRFLRWAIARLKHGLALLFREDVFKITIHKIKVQILQITNTLIIYTFQVGSDFEWTVRAQVWTWVCWVKKFFRSQVGSDFELTVRAFCDNSMLNWYEFKYRYFCNLWTRT